MVSKQSKRSNSKALVLILAPFLLVGCETTRDWFGVAADVCDAVHKVKERCHERK